MYLYHICDSDTVNIFVRGASIMDETFYSFFEARPKLHPSNPSL